MQLTTDNDGMGIWVTLDTENNSEARALYSAVQRGDISGMSFMFGIRDEEWENLDSDHPTHHIRDISTVVEVSAVTFPAYESTEINARSKEALDNARSAVETARQQGAPSVETDDLELLKEKSKNLRRFLSGQKESIRETPGKTAGEENKTDRESTCITGCSGSEKYQRRIERTE